MCLLLEKNKLKINGIQSKMWFLNPSAFVLLEHLGTKWYPGAKWSLQLPGPSVEHLYWMKKLLQRQQFWWHWQLQKTAEADFKRMLGRNLEPNIFKLLHRASVEPQCCSLSLKMVNSRALNAVWETDLSFFLLRAEVSEHKTGRWGKSQQAI